MSQQEAIHIARFPPPRLEPSRTLRLLNTVSLNTDMSPGNQHGASPVPGSQSSPKLCDQEQCLVQDRMPPFMMADLQEYKS